MITWILILCTNIQILILIDLNLKEFMLKKKANKRNLKQMKYNFCLMMKIKADQLIFIVLVSKPPSQPFRNFIFIFQVLFLHLNIIDDNYQLN
jgi:hypothetical protein